MIKIHAANLKPSALTDWTYDFIKEKILNLEIKPGEQINIDEIAEKLKVSRTPIREAFLKLAAEGLIEVRPRVGYFVVQITEQVIRDLFEIREIIETRAVKKAILLMSNDDLNAMKILVDETRDAVEKGDLGTFVQNDFKFHKYLQNQIQNKLLSSFMDSMNDLTYRVRVSSFQSEENIEQTVIEHNNIYKALSVRDSDEAEKYICDHLEKVCERMINLLVKN